MGKGVNMWEALGKFGVELAVVTAKTIAVTAAIVGTVAVADALSAKPARRTPARRNRRPAQA